MVQAFSNFALNNTFSDSFLCISINRWYLIVFPEHDKRLHLPKKYSWFDRPSVWCVWITKTGSLSYLGQLNVNIYLNYDVSSSSLSLTKKKAQNIRNHAFWYPAVYVYVVLVRSFFVILRWVEERYRLY